MKPSKLFLVWLTGFYEGEGSLAVNKFGTTAMYLYQKELQVLKLIQRKVGGKLTNPVTDKKTGRRVGRLRFSHSDSIKLIRLLLPFMKSNHRTIQAKTVLRKIK